MTLTQPFSLAATTPPRWLLLVSLALNLFFIGVAAALLLRGPPPIDRSVAGRMDRLAAALPANDGEILRGEFKAARTAVEAARDNFTRERDNIRAALRREPFDPAALQAATDRARAARQDFDQALQGVIAKAAAEMSPLGRQKLADWPPGSQGQQPHQ